jgi:AcrR family transcriptional regulator
MSFNLTGELTAQPRDPPSPPLPHGSATSGASAPPRGVSDARERILRASYDLFCRDGIHATGIDRIVADAGVAKATLYRHFASKDDLVRAVLDVREELWIHGWLEYEAERRGATPVERLLAVFDAFDDWFRRDGYEGCLFIKSLLETAGQDGPLFDAAARKQANVRAVLRRWAEEAGARDPGALAYEWQTLMAGAIVVATAGDPEAARRARGIAELVLDREGLH